MAHPPSHSTAHGDGAHGGHHGHYVAPPSLLWKVFGALVGLTILTVATGTADWIPGALHVPIALTIAFIKVVLVAMFFMGLKHDNRVNTVILVLTSIFVVVFLGFTLFDVTQRGDLGNVDKMNAADRAYLLQQDSARYAASEALRAAATDSTAASVDSAGVPAVLPADSIATTPAAPADTATGASATPATAPN